MEPTVRSTMEKYFDSGFCTGHRNEVFGGCRNALLLVFSAFLCCFQKSFVQILTPILCEQAVRGGKKAFKLSLEQSNPPNWPSGLWPIKGQMGVT